MWCLGLGFEYVSVQSIILGAPSEAVAWLCPAPLRGWRGVSHEGMGRSHQRFQWMEDLEILFEDSVEDSARRGRAPPQGGVVGGVAAVPAPRRRDSAKSFPEESREMYVFGKGCAVASFCEARKLLDLWVRCACVGGGGGASRAIAAGPCGPKHAPLMHMYQVECHRRMAIHARCCLCTQAVQPHPAPQLTSRAPTPSCSRHTCHVDHNM